jgi:hypothetical protein
MRHFLILAAALLWTGAAFADGIKSISQIVLYKNGWTPISGNPLSNWRAYSHAYSSTTFYMPFDRLKTGGAVLVSVDLLVVFRAVSPTAWNGVALFACPAQTDAANADLVTYCPYMSYFAASDVEFSPNTPGCAGSGGGPHPCHRDLTADFNKLILDGVPYYLAIGTYGNGSNGPEVYDVELQLSWQ